MKSFSAQTHYEVLEVSVGATSIEVQSAYERLVRLYSEDQVVLYGLVEPERAKALRERLKAALDVLADDARRDEYDRTIGLPPRERPQAAGATAAAPAAARPSGGWGGPVAYVSQPPPPPPATAPPTYFTVNPLGGTRQASAPRPPAPAAQPADPITGARTAVRAARATPSEPRPAASPPPPASVFTLPRLTAPNPQSHASPPRGAAEAAPAPAPMPEPPPDLSSDLAAPVARVPATPPSPAAAVDLAAPSAATVASAQTGGDGVGPEAAAAAPTADQYAVLRAAAEAAGQEEPAPPRSGAAPAEPVRPAPAGPGVAAPVYGDPALAGGLLPAAVVAEALSAPRAEPSVEPETPAPVPAAAAAEPVAVAAAGEESALVATKPAREFKAEPRPKPYEVPEGVEFNGDLLKQVRMARGQSLAQLAERTRISVRHLENVEGDRYEQLPAVVYLRGILMSIARELGLDGLRVASSYLAFVEARRSKG